MHGILVKVGQDWKESSWVGRVIQSMCILGMFVWVVAAVVFLLLFPEVILFITIIVSAIGGIIYFSDLIDDGEG